MTSTPAVTSHTTSHPLNQTFTFTSSGAAANDVTRNHPVASPTTPEDPEVRAFEIRFCLSNLENETFLLPSDLYYMVGVSYSSVVLTDTSHDVEDYDYEDEVFANHSYLTSPVPEGKLPLPRRQRD